MFSVGIKVYAFHNSITAVRVVIAKMVPLEEDLIKKLSPPVPNEQKRAS